MVSSDRLGLTEMEPRQEVLAPGPHGYLGLSGFPGVEQGAAILWGRSYSR